MMIKKTRKAEHKNPKTYQMKMVVGQHVSQCSSFDDGEQQQIEAGFDVQANVEMLISVDDDEQGQQDGLDVGDEQWQKRLQDDGEHIVAD